MSTAGALAALRPAPVRVRFGGKAWMIPALPAADWIEAVLAGEAGSIFPGLLERREDEDRVWALLITGAGAPDDLVMCARQALEVAAGRKWWVADKLIRLATDETVRAAVVGSMGSTGLDLQRISVGLFCDAVLGRILGGVSDEMERERLLTELEAIPGNVTEEDMEDEDDEAEFMRHVGDRGAG